MTFVYVKLQDAPVLGHNLCRVPRAMRDEQALSFTFSPIREAAVAMTAMLHFPHYFKTFLALKTYTKLPLCPSEVDVFKT